LVQLKGTADRWATESDRIVREIKEQPQRGEWRYTPQLNSNTGWNVRPAAANGRIGYLSVLIAR